MSEIDISEAKALVSLNIKVYIKQTVNPVIIVLTIPCFQNMFAVDAVTGVIKVSSNLDRKYVVETTFDVQCTDINGVANLPQSATCKWAALFWLSMH